ncbi:tyrosine-type recombinase/integrase [Nesterenkonia massiliensis]|uniref:Tyrosine-type recombinase/integrase n=1 Tax=Nesterenkonia massiliensis TaxID=1232429 RepID=A0ABT2HQR2_9MICC|nr:tyrosine-type recombinase/integrase [Nesterenkonia massiliensis]MCT1607029.1 tyrosine-type recombinase/integrase [Nesterenkonia massiliensis]
MAESTRRSNGEGTKPTLRKDGRYQSHVTVALDSDGEPIRKTVYGKTRTECTANARKLIRQVQDGTVTIGAQPTLGEWVHHWLYTIKQPQVKNSTFEGYEKKVRWLKDTQLQRTKLNKISHADIEGFYAQKREEGAATESLLQFHSILSGAFKAAVKRKQLGANPMLMVDRPRGSASEVYTPPEFHPDEARKLIKKAEELARKDIDRMEAGGWTEGQDLSRACRYMIALCYGPRQSEVLGIGWDTTDLEAGTIELTRTLMAHKWRHGCEDPIECPGNKNKDKQARYCPERKGGGMYFDTPKSKAGRRGYPIPEQVVTWLTRLKRLHQDLDRSEGERRRPYTDPNGVTAPLVFCQLNGRPWRPEQDAQGWKTFLKDAGVPHKRLHDARHVSATMLLMLGIDGRVVMDLMGWSQRALLDRYQHVVNNLKQDVAAQVGAALWAEPEAPTPSPDEPVAGVTSLAEWRKKKTG